MKLPRIPGFDVRPIVPADAPAWARYVCLPEVKRYTSSTVQTVDEVHATIERIVSSTPLLPTHFVLMPSGTHDLVATVGFHTVSLLNGTAEVTYDVDPTHWGTGIGTAACKAATAWAFDVAGWHRVQATTVLPHLRSQRVLEKCGFKREGIARNFRIVGGQPADYWLFSAIPGDVQSGA